MIYKQYYVCSTDYKVKARDLSTSRERIYDAERFQVDLSGGDYSSSYYYDGDLPWLTFAVAAWMFSVYWSSPFQGVSSYIIIQYYN